jgi:hypothetical protein
LYCFSDIRSTRTLRWASRSTKILGENWSRKRVSDIGCFTQARTHCPYIEEEEEEEESEEEEEEEEEATPAPADGLQTPSGLETPSGMASVVSTVAGGLETPDFLELRKNAGRAQSEANDGPRSLYHVLPEKQTSVRGLMGSERGYDVSAVAGGSNANLPVLGDERGRKVCIPHQYPPSRLTTITAQGQRRGYIHRRIRVGGHVGGGTAKKIRLAFERECGGTGVEGRLLGHGCSRDCQTTEDGEGAATEAVGEG